MQFTTLNFEQKNGIGLLTINRPEALNALRSNLLSELDQFCQQIIQTELRCLIITGSGNKAFVAGADIKEMQQLTPEQAKVFAQNGQRTFDRIADLPFTSIAAVNGFALGGGMELALACDFIVASEKARFGLPEITLGLIPGFGGTQRLTRCVGANNARRMILTGNMINADEALTMGLVSIVSSDEELLPTVQKVAQSITNASPNAIRLAKQAVNQGAELPLAQALDLEAGQFSAAFKHPQSTEGLAAFVEKRKAVF